MPALTSSSGTATSTNASGGTTTTTTLTLDFSAFLGLGILENDPGVIPLGYDGSAPTSGYGTFSPDELAVARWVEYALPTGGGFGGRGRTVTFSEDPGALALTGEAGRWTAANPVNLGFGTWAIEYDDSLLTIELAAWPILTTQGSGAADVGVAFTLDAGAQAVLAQFFDPVPTHLVATADGDVLTKFYLVRNELAPATWMRWQPFPYRCMGTPLVGLSDWPSQPCPAALGDQPAVIARYGSDGQQFFVGSEIHGRVPYPAILTGVSIPAGGSLAWGVPTSVFCGHYIAVAYDPSLTSWEVLATYFDAGGSILLADQVILTIAPGTYPAAGYMGVPAADRAVTMTPPAGARTYSLSSRAVGMGLQPAPGFGTWVPATPRCLPAQYTNPLEDTPLAIAGQVALVE